MNEPQAGSKWIRRILWSGGVVVLLGVLGVVWVVYPVAPGGYEVSEETTRYLEPLDDGGRVDYAAILAEKTSSGLPSEEENAAVRLIPRMDPDFLRGPMREKVWSRLGIPPGARAGDGAEKPRRGLRGRAAREFHDQFAEAESRPWTEEEFPAVAGWLSERASTMEELESICGLRRFDLPIYECEPTKLGLSALEPFWGSLHDLAQPFVIRGQLRVARGDLDGAVADFARVHRMSGWIEHRGFTALLIARNMRGKAYRILEGLVEQGEPSGELLRTVLDRVGETPDVWESLGAVLEISRITTLDLMDRMARSDGVAEGSGIDWALRVATFDGPVAMRTTNRHFDAVFASLDREGDLEKATSLERAVRSVVEASEIRDGMTGVTALARLLRAAPGNRPRLLGRWLADYWCSLVIFPLERTVVPFRKQVTWQRLIAVGASILIHRGRTGSLPASLDDLKRSFPGLETEDPFTGRPLVYRSSRNGFAVSSVGPGGNASGNEDLVLRRSW